MFRILTLVLSGAFFFLNFAEASTLQNQQFNEYYTVSERVAKIAVSMQPTDVLRDFFANEENFTTLKTQILNLLNFEHHKDTFGTSAEPYQRIKHFGTWLRNEQTCLNTRADVLARDSQEEVTYSNGGRGCTVSTGVWDDPYTGDQYTQAADIQIDHVVPLKNAFVSGASKWSYQHRCLYANFLGNNYHLMSVDGNENMKKSDKGPENYMPPNPSYQCAYVQRWISIKLIWGLGLNPNETEAIQQIVKDNNCKAKDFQFSMADLQNQRTYIQDNLSICIQR